MEVWVIGDGECFPDRMCDTEVEDVCHSTPMVALQTNQVSAYEMTSRYQHHHKGG